MIVNAVIVMVTIAFFIVISSRKVIFTSYSAFDAHRARPLPKGGLYVSICY